MSEDGWRRRDWADIGHGDKILRAINTLSRLWSQKIHCGAPDTGRRSQRHDKYQSAPSVKRLQFKCLNKNNILQILFCKIR